MPSPKSFYHLEFSVSPGGARMDAHFVRATFDEIRRDLTEQLEQGISLYLLCWYGAKLRLESYRAGQLIQELDLHAFLEISIEGYPTVTFDGEGKPVGYDFKNEQQEDEADMLSVKLFGGELESVTSVRVDWERMNIPTLDQDLVAEGDMVTLDGKWREGEALTHDDLLDEGWLPAGYVDNEM